MGIILLCVLSFLFCYFLSSPWALAGCSQKWKIFPSHRQKSVCCPHRRGWWISPSVWWLHQQSRLIERIPPDSRAKTQQRCEGPKGRAERSDGQKVRKAREDTDEEEERRRGRKRRRRRRQKWNRRNAAEFQSCFFSFNARRKSRRLISSLRCLKTFTSCGDTTTHNRPDLTRQRWGKKKR